MARIKLELPETFVFSTLIPIRITDLNYGAHVGNDAILSLMHEARVQFLKQYHCTELNLFGASLIQADTAIIYKAESFYGDVLKCEVSPAEFSRVGFDLYYRFTHAEKHYEIAVAKTGMICFDYQSRKVLAVPQEFVNLFTKNN
jgi:acyl-CoA thioesterase FadM